MGIMSKPVFLILGGLVLLGLAAVDFFRAMTTGSIKLRGGALITRSHSPRVFWFNIVGQIVVAVGGAALACWGLSQAWLR